MSRRLFLVVSALLCCAGVQPMNVQGEASSDRSVKIQTFVGQTVVLPCQIKVSEYENVPSVEWSKEGPKPNIAFLYRQGCETFEEKNPDFHYRTNLFMKEVISGNMSLRLSDVRLSDAGTYKCRRIPIEPQDASTIELSVGAASEPKLSLVRGAGVTLHCEASCWFPLPEITFLDAQKNVISAQEPKNPSRSGCFTATRRATVQTGNRFTCRVHQPEINQTRNTEIYIPDDCMGSCTQNISIAVLASAVLSAIIAFLCGKYCNSDGVRKLLSNQWSLQSSTRSNAERQNLRNQADSVQNAANEHRRKVDELKSNLHDKDEFIRRLTGELEDLRSQQSAVVCRQPMNLVPEFPHVIDLQPAASTNNSSPDLLTNSGAASPIAASPAASPATSPAASPAASPVASPAFLAGGPLVGLSRTMSESRPRSNAAKVPRRSTISVPSSNRYNVLANLREDDAEPLL